MAGKQQQQQGVVVAEPSVARRLWRVVRAVLYMLRRGLPSGRKLTMDLHLLLHRGKMAGKVLRDLLAFHHSHHRAAFSSSSANAGGGSCRTLDPSLAVHEPSRGRREVEFSCSTTPLATGGSGLHLLGAGKSRRRNHHHRDDASAAAGTGYLHYYNYDAADVARVFEMLNDTDHLFTDDEPPMMPASSATPSPAQLLWASFGRSPAAATATSRKLRITNSPFQTAASRGVDDAQVDRRADEFIRRFYEQLRAQKSAASTPNYYGYAPSPYASGRTPRSLAAGIA
ncbi:uncharacterized protein LOC133917423 [Phragmites australis]|uniref:uncharacterized protein LOC133917423 n=1 Tax=Phragmites australis TaxID=29695 RepID=UPI002D79551F|nr:uncharacterized protein LOC133917423 [Phragmites australis]